MSRVAKNPVVIPGGVEVKISGAELSVKGPLGTASHRVDPAVVVELEGAALVVRQREGAANANALAGTTRALVNNIVTGVSKGFEKKLTLVGVGYRAQVQCDKLNLSLGFSHPVVYQLPKGVQAETPSQTEIVIKGIDKQQIGQVAAEVRAFRAPEPYKGKGVRYADERVVIKETKKK